jgi:hypothetical protein
VKAKSIVLVKSRASHVTVPLGVASSMFPASSASTTGSAVDVLLGSWGLTRVDDVG